MTDGDISLSPPRGMRDFYPEDMRIRETVFEAWRKASTKFGFEPYDSCVVEELALLKRKAGEEIVEQIYTFKDKSGRDLALRPEMTPTLARMVASRQASLPMPLKWYTIAQCFRYERMTRGRKREHYQWNLDIVGEDSPAAEAEILACAVSATDTLGLSSADYRIHFNSRELLCDLLVAAEVQSTAHGSVFLALDKRGKIEDTEVASMLKAAGLADRQVSRIFDCLNATSLDDIAKFVDSSVSSLQRLRSLEMMLREHGVADRTVFDPGIVRGLAYYTGIVFEAFDTGGKLRAIFGGGRYNNLLSSIGGKPAAAVGLGFGDVVIAELLHELGRTPNRNQRPVTAVGFMSEAERSEAIGIASALRRLGTNVDFGLAPEKPKRFFGRVGSSGFEKAIYIGPDDIAAGSVRVKNLIDRTETPVSIAALKTGGAPC